MGGQWRDDGDGHQPYPLTQAFHGDRPDLLCLGLRVLPQASGRGPDRNRQLGSPHAAAGTQASPEVDSHNSSCSNRRSAATAARSVGRSIRAQTLRSDAEPGEGDG